jgi:hypothetical protein
VLCPGRGPAANPERCETGSDPLTSPFRVVEGAGFEPLGPPSTVSSVHPGARATRPHAAFVKLRNADRSRRRAICGMPRAAQDKAGLEFEIGYGDFEHLAASLCARLGNV